MLVNTKAKIGVFSIALGAYLPQFPSLVPEFEGQYADFKKMIPESVEIVDGGIVTTKELAQAAGDKFRAADVDLVILQLLTYATSYNMLPAVRDLDVPVVLVNIQKKMAPDYENTDTATWLGGEYFLVTGSLKYFRNVAIFPEDSFCIIELDEKGENYRICWGLVNGGRPTSELPSHLMNHEVKVIATDGKHRVIYHAHPANTIALTFVLPLTDEAFTRELWEMATECPVVFPSGIGVVPWMVPGGRDIAVATSELMKQYDVAIWAHHGMFCSGEDFDLTFGLMHTVEKSAEILVKVRSMQPYKRQTIQPNEFRHLARDFNVELPEKFLYEKY